MKEAEASGDRKAEVLEGEEEIQEDLKEDLKEDIEIQEADTEAGAEGILVLIQEERMIVEAGEDTPGEILEGGSNKKI